MKKFNLLLIGNNLLKKYFSSQFNVIIPKFKEKFYISEICKEYNIHVVLQVENLGRREIIYDISEQNCLKIFWAIDIHLNYYWQKYYFKNFDIILTTQRNFVFEYKGKIYWLPWGIPDEDISDEFIPFSEREYKISFVGLIDENRIKRKTIIDLIKSKFQINLKGTTLATRLNYHEMLNIYRNSWIVINESINRDINFRYFEVTSQGALLYSEKINNGEEILFKDKYEVLYYSQLNLFKRLNYFMKYPKQIEKIAYNGWLKTKKFHKLSDRVKIIEKIIIENISNYEKRTKEICYPMMLTYLRAIGEPFYKKDFFKFCKDEVLKALFVKCFNEKSFIEISIKLKDYPLIQLNLIKDIEEAKKFINNNYNKIPEYFTGYLNLMAKNNMYLTIYELIAHFFKKFPNKAIKDKNLNYIGGKILFKNRNFQGAIGHFLNLVREFPEVVLFRKYLAACYFKIYNFELFYSEILKIFLLEKKFKDFKKFNVDIQLKKEAIYDITKHIKNKKLIRDIIFNLSDFYESHT